MKSKFLLWSSAAMACFSASWVFLLVALVVRCKLSGQPFPVLAKFSPFHDHLLITDRMLQLFPVLALLAAGLLGIVWYRERDFALVRGAAIAIGFGIVVSGLVTALNPGGYLSWFLS